MTARAATVWFIDSPDPAGDLRAAVHPAPDDSGNPLPRHDVGRAQQLASTIYGDSVLVPLVDTDLATAAAARDHHVYAGFYGPLAVISCSLFETTTPSMLTRTLAAIRPSSVATLLHVDPDTAFGAFARWEQGTLRRSFSADPVTIHEDQGLPFTFERPFWAGEFPIPFTERFAAQPMALPFHPGQLAEEANRDWLGFRFTHPFSPTDLDPASIPVTCFALHPAEYEPTPEDFEAYRAANAARNGRRGVERHDVEIGEPGPERGRRRKGRIRAYFGF
ncbi:DUF6928 family protein [Gordonia aurantiaca]|uniref:DUF6928 family protein n=1 Tax=Gordonia sp. B21 TaxID=3151852 RepID=UPI003264FC55